MSKKKTRLEPFSQYAIFDLPVEDCIQRAIDQFKDNPLAEAKLIYEDRLDVVYRLSTVEYSTVDATATIMRWQGTQTRVMFHMKSHADGVTTPLQSLLNFLEIVFRLSFCSLFFS
jgi:hypothetical protein